MKIQTLAAVILSTLAISTANATDATMPTGDNMMQSTTAPAASADDKMAEKATPAKKHTKKHKNHKKHAAEAAPTATDAPAAATMEPAK